MSYFAAPAGGNLPDEYEDFISTASYQRLSALEKFIYDYTPSFHAEEWREALEAVLKEAK